jgi:hypothetical protein
MNLMAMNQQNYRRIVCIKSSVLYSMSALLPLPPQRLFFKRGATTRSSPRPQQPGAQPPLGRAGYSVQIDHFYAQMCLCRKCAPEIFVSCLFRV